MTSTERREHRLSELPAMRASASAAEAVFRDAIPSTALRRRAAKLLADAIECSHAVGGSTWGVTLFEDGLRLNVGQVEVLVIRPGGLYAVSGVPAEPLPGAVSTHVRVHRRGLYASVPGGQATWRVPYGVLPSVMPHLAPCHRAFVQRAATRASGKPRETPFKASFSSGVVDYLRTTLGRAVPFPDYAPRERSLGATTRSVRPGDGDAGPHHADESGVVVALEGELRMRYSRHRNRERWLRDGKIEAAISTTSDGRLCCEVPGCGFDFEAVYGGLGRRYAQVHHLLPLSSADELRETRLEDLAIVCANCHVMIHRDGQSRPLDGLIADR
jgi:hypothetical protein